MEVFADDVGVEWGLDSLGEMLGGCAEGISRFCPDTMACRANLRCSEKRRFEGGCGGP
jgi:hypothetical protein